MVFFVFSVVITSLAVIDGKIVVADTDHADRLRALRRVAKENPVYLETLMRIRHPGLACYAMPKELLAA